MPPHAPDSADAQLDVATGHMKPRNLTLVLPARNEEARLPPALDHLFDYLRKQAREETASSLPPEIRVLVVNAASTDATADIVLARPEASGTLEGVSLDLLTVADGGKGAAVRAGVLASETDMVIFADADMATPASQLPVLVEALRRADVALGSRIQPDGSDMRVTQPRYRRLLGRAFHIAASFWVAGLVPDTQCGFKGFRREAAHDVFARQRVTSVAFDVELIYVCRRRGYRVAVVPIEWYDRDGSRLRMSPRSVLRLAWDLFRIPLLHRRVGRASAMASTGTPEWPVAEKRR